MSSSERFGQFLNPGADSLLGKVDFFGVIGAFGRTYVVAFFLALAAIPMAIVGAFEEVIDAVRFFLRSPFEALSAVLSSLQSMAIAAAAGDLPEFELFALPVSVVAALGPVLVVAFVIALFWGFD